MSTRRSIDDNRRKIYRFIVENLTNDVPKQVIFNELSPLLIEQAELARLVHSFPSKKMFKNAKLHRYFLALALLVLFVAGVSIIWFVYFEENNKLSLNSKFFSAAFATILQLCGLVFDIRGLLFFSKQFVPVGLLFSIFLAILPPYQFYSGDLLFVKVAAVLLVIVGLSLYCYKLKAGMFYREQKDANGNYVLND
ncbi:MAG: hypothetical protein RL660_3151 [Bacteroidota bacterium]|jgi:magnesium-transporting ATPase (P-type)